jgi:LAO/AO transport system kinase
MASELADRLAEAVLAGDVRAVARACRLVDDRLAGYRPLLRALFPHTGRAWVLGITGPPGVGKSTLTDCLIREFRLLGKRVGVLAIDPTSPFSGGAILGDRIRMQQHFEDPQVFIRSLATRGALGGLSRSAADLVTVLDAWQAEVVLVETVGVGQDELEISRAAHTTLVVMSPGLGDDVQAAKAGLMECADVFAVNKADREGADSTVSDILQMVLLGRDQKPLGLRHGAASSIASSAPAPGAATQGWAPPVLKCVANRQQGIAELMDSLRAHRLWLEQTPRGNARKCERAREYLLHTLRDAVCDEVLARLAPQIEEAVARIEARSADPYSVCDDLVASLTPR